MLLMIFPHHVVNTVMIVTSETVDEEGQRWLFLFAELTFIFCRPAHSTLPQIYYYRSERKLLQIAIFFTGSYHSYVCFRAFTWSTLPSEASRTK